MKYDGKTCKAGHLCFLLISIYLTMYSNETILVCDVIIFITFMHSGIKGKNVKYGLNKCFFNKCILY